MCRMRRFLQCTKHQVVQSERQTFRGLKVMEEKEETLFCEPMPGIGPPPLTFSWLMKGLEKSADVPVLKSYTSARGAGRRLL